MTLPFTNEYLQILNKMNNNILPTYIPVNSEAAFNYDVYSYYNQYYASPYVTQQRRILRNYYNNNQSIKESNKNPFINNIGKKFYFLYTYAQNYMIIEQNKTTTIYILIKNCWCKLKVFNCIYNKNEIKNFIESIAIQKI